MISGAPANVLDFGADPTGVTSSSAAFQSAIAETNNIYIPAGTFYPKNATATLASTDSYKKTDYEIIIAENQSLSWSHTGDVTKDLSTFRATDFDIRFSTIAGGIITKLKIIGDIYYKGNPSIFSKGDISPKKKSIK